MVREKSGNSDRLSEHKRFTTPQVQLDSSFCQNAISKSHGKSSEVREESGKMKVEKKWPPYSNLIQPDSSNSGAHGSLDMNSEN